MEAVAEEDSLAVWSSEGHRKCKAGPCHVAFIWEEGSSGEWRGAALGEQRGVEPCRVHRAEMSGAERSSSGSNMAFSGPLLSPASLEVSYFPLTPCTAGMGREHSHWAWAKDPVHPCPSVVLFETIKMLGVSCHPAKPFQSCPRLYVVYDINMGPNTIHRLFWFSSDFLQLLPKLSLILAEPKTLSSIIL